LVNGRNGERPKRSSGELYDAIWAANLPPIMDERDNRAAAVTPVVARMVLMAMASFTNPNRDQVLGPTKTWQCFAAVATLAEKADVSERQVQRVLRALEREGYIELLYQARRPGRPRKNQQPLHGRPNTWCLRPDRWPARTLENHAGVVAISSAETETRPVPVEVASVPANFSGNSAGTGHEGAEKPTGGVTLTRSTYEPIKDRNPIKKPAAATASAPNTGNQMPLNEGVDGDGEHDRARVSERSTQPSLGRMLTPVPPTPTPRCIKCHKRQDEPAGSACRNPAWHSSPPTPVDQPELTRASCESDNSPAVLNEVELAGERLVSNGRLS
jgi:hypothetical protein